MRRLRAWLLPPALGAGPRETLEWVRRFELASGVGSLACGLALWSAGWWHWVLIGLGLFGISPWPGAAAILRRAEQRPEILQTDRARGRARARRVTRVIAVLYPLLGGVAGFLLDGWPAAIPVAALSGLGAALAIWWMHRRWRAEDANEQTHE